MLTGTVSDFDSDGLFGVITQRMGGCCFSICADPAAASRAVQDRDTRAIPSSESPIAPRAISLVPLDVETTLLTWIVRMQLTLRSERGFRSGRRVRGRGASH